MRGITVYMTVTIPIGLTYDGPEPDHVIASNAAENFLNHPAIKDGNPELLLEFTDKMLVVQEQYEIETFKPLNDKEEA